MVRRRGTGRHKGHYKHYSVAPNKSTALIVQRVLRSGGWQTQSRKTRSGEYTIGFR